MHMVETMAYVGQKPWHGLGNKLARQQSIEVWKQQAGMDWQIEESEVRYVTGSHNIGAANTGSYLYGIGLTGEHQMGIGPLYVCCVTTGFREP